MEHGMSHGTDRIHQRQYHWTNCIPAAAHSTIGGDSLQLGEGTDVSCTS